MRNLADYRNYVWTYLDLDAEDTPATLIDTWVLEGFRKIIKTIKRWPFYEMSGTIQTVADQRAYAMPEGMEDVRKIDAPWSVLKYIDYGEAYDKFHLYSGIVSRGSARAFSIWEGNIQIWPIPDEGETLTVVGYRSPLNWIEVGAGATPDFPEEFEDALLAWVMYRAHMHQDDPELAAASKMDYQETLDALTAHEISGPSAFPLVLGGGGVRARPLPNRLAYPWE